MERGVLCPLGFELGAGVLVGVVYNFELARVDVEDGSREDVFKLNACILAPFEEDPFILQVELHVIPCTISMLLSLRK